MDNWTGLADYIRKIPAVFLVAILSVLALIIFMPEQQAKMLAVDEFRGQFRVYLGPAFLLTVSFCVARIFTFLMQAHNQRKALKQRQQRLNQLTPEEKGYLIPYIHEQQNSIHVGMDDGVMAGLRSKGITYLAANMGDLINGFAFNLQPWAREHLEKNPQLLDGHSGHPMTPGQKLNSRW